MGIRELRMAGKVSARLAPWLRVKIMAGAVTVLLLVFVGIFGAAIAPFDPNHQELSKSLLPPQWFGGSYFLGTDNLGRDILSRIIVGARVSLVVSSAVVLIAGLVGVTLGVISGYIGGVVDYAIQKLVELVWAFPSLLLAIIFLALFGQGVLPLVFALIASRWIQYCRVVRGEALSLREREFVSAARVLGATEGLIVLRHILPNLVSSTVVIGTFGMATAIIDEASLSFLGVGVPPDVPSWGNMLADGRNYIIAAPWLSLFPGLCIFAVVIGINLLGDGFRDAFDPRTGESAAVGGRS
jgi:peptide/nickel transport system permease protein